MANGTTIANMNIALYFDGKSLSSSMSSVEKQAVKQSDKAGDKAGKALSGKWAAAAGAIAGVTQQVFSKVTSTISSSVGSAISRMDTMNNFPKVMESLGYASDEASSSIQMMSDHLDGLPTTLNDMVSNTQMLAASMGNLNNGTVNATSVGLAFNDMMLAGGRGTEAASRAFVQYNQMLAKGKVDMQSWNSIVEAAPGQMNQLAQSLLGAEKGQRDLYEALQSGAVSFDQLNAAMVKLDTEGGAGFESFNKQAVAGTQGLQTQIENLYTSITKVIAAAFNGDDLTKPIDQLVSRFGSLAKQLVPAVGNIVNATIKVLPKLLESLLTAIIDYLPTFIDGLVALIPDLVNSLVDLVTNVATQLAEQLPVILVGIVNGLVAWLQTIYAPENMQKVLQAGIKLLMGLVDALPQVLIALISALPNIITGIITFLLDPVNIGMIINAAIQLFFGIVQAVPQILGALLGAFGTLVGNLWNGITKMFGEFASNFGNFIGGIFKKAINGVISFIENFINTPIGVINGFIDVINNAFGGVGVNLGKISKIQLPRLAQGGIAMSATTAIIGEEGREAVIPLENNTGNWAGLLANTLAAEMRDQNLVEDEQRPVVVNFYNATVRDDNDIQKITQGISQAMRRAA